MPVGAFIPRLEVLIVDDDPDVRDLLAEFFAARSFPVATAASGQAALSAIEHDPRRYGLIVTDLQMPGADGLTVLRAAKRANPACCVVILTGYATLDSAIQAVRLGAYDYLTKPFSLGQIEVVLQRLRDHLALESENRQLAREIERREAGMLARLDAIDARLSRIETMLARFSALPSGVPPDGR